MFARCLDVKICALVPCASPRSRQSAFRGHALKVRAISMVHQSTGSFVNARKQNLRTVEYLPDQPSPKALLFFHHGYGEHISRYERGKHCTTFATHLLAGIPDEQRLLQGFLMGVYRSIIPQMLLTMLIIVGGMPVHTRLAEAGIAVYGYDHHGHGESEPKEARERALVHDFNHLVCIPAQAPLGTQRLAWQSKFLQATLHDLSFRIWFGASLWKVLQEKGNHQYCHA